jgi:hypothetical protein
MHKEEWAALHDGLKEPFPADQIHWRVGATTKDKKKGMALAYLDARDVMDRLDAVVGPQNWSDTYCEVNGVTVCTISIRLDWEYGPGVSKSDGAGATDVEGEKGALSDAFKRCAVKFGVGRYLYRLPSKWAELNDRGYIINPPSLPTWALPVSTEDKAVSATPKASQSPSPHLPNWDSSTEDMQKQIVAILLSIRKQYGDGAEHRIEGLCEYWDIEHKPKGFIDFSVLKDENVPKVLEHIIKLEKGLSDASD